MREEYLRDWRRQNPDKTRANNARRVRMRAGGIQFYLGQAPTVEAAQHLRRKIREEAPRAAVQDS